MSGVTATGWEGKTYAQIRGDLEARLRETIARSIPTTGNTKWGNLINIVASEIAEAWEVGEDIYSAFTPEGATGAALTSLAAITATVRRGPTKSTVMATCVGVPGTAIPAGRVFSVVDTGARFVTIEDATIGGSGTVGVECAAEVAGPVAANSGTLEGIETPVFGLDSVTNLEDADEGSNEETDAELVSRREDELRGQGKGAAPAIRTAISRLEGVTAVNVFENTSLVTDGDGLPPKSFLVLVAGGDDTEIITAIFHSKPVGMPPYVPPGGISQAVSFGGIDYTIGFARPVDVDVWVTVTLEVVSEKYPVDGDEQVEEAILDWADIGLSGGDDVVAAAIGARAFGIPGVKNATVLIGLANPPVSSATLTITPFQRADLDTSRLVVTSTPVSP